MIYYSKTIKIKINQNKNCKKNKKNWKMMMILQNIIIMMELNIEKRLLEEEPRCFNNKVLDYIKLMKKKNPKYEIILIIYYKFYIGLF